MEYRRFIARKECGSEMARAVFIVLVVGLALAIGATMIQRTHAAGAEKAAASPLAGGSPPPAAGGRTLIVLKNGNQLSGDVLKEKADSIVLDLGFAVLTVPVEDIQERRLESQAADLKLQGGPDRIYTEVDPRAHQERPVKALADELGGSVAVVQTPAALGSCFAIDDRGYFVTNCHVIQGEQEISIKLFRKGMAGSDTLKIDKVQIVAMSPFMDLALLKATIPPDVHLRALPLGFSDSIQNGQTVFAIGSPLGLERTVSQGIVSARRRSFEGQPFLQMTAAINPGNSGGPLFDLRGEVIGVTSMKAGLFSEGLGFAIPVDTLKSFLRDRDVYAFDKDNPNNGYRYLPPPRKPAAKPAE
jgi:serine protease Do